MSNRDLLKEAIADAKTIKETAIANAKVALEEAFAPQLRSMLSAKLEEMEKEDMDEGYDEKMDEAKDEMEEGYNKDMDEAKDDMYEAKDEMDEDVDLDEILAELEKGEDKEDVKEAEEMDETIDEAEEDEEVEVDAESEMEGEDEDEEIDLEEMSEDDLKSFIEDVIADMVEAGELEAGEEFDAEEEMEGEEEIEIEDEAEPMMEGKEKEEVEEGELNEEAALFHQMLAGIMDYFNTDLQGAQSILIGAGAAFPVIAASGAVALDKIKKVFNPSEVPVKKASPEEITADKKELEANKDAINRRVAAAIAKSKSLTGAMEEGKEESMDEGSYDDMMEEVNQLKAELHEVNLLNAKLLYSNKIFRAKNLKEAQKVKVLEAFDRAETVNEVKLVFETLTEKVKETKTIVKENLGSASRAAGIAPTRKAPIVEVNPQVARWQKLAGIK